MASRHGASRTNPKSAPGLSQCKGGVEHGMGRSRVRSGPSLAGDPGETRYELGLRGIRCWLGVAALGFGIVLGTPSRVQAAPEAPAAPATERAPSSGRSVRVPASQDQRELAVQLAADGLWFRACVERVCDARGGRRLDLPAAALAALERASLQVLEPSPGRRLVHVRIPAGEGAWEALIAAGLAALDPVVIFAGETGPVEGEDGQRQGAMLWVRDEGKGHRVLVGRMQEDVQLCGRPTILEPRLLDANLSLRPAKVQRLTLEERRAARALPALRAEAGPTPGGNALRAVVASSALGDPRALTDGRSDTSWSEGRGGDGRGEFVILRPWSGVDLVALELLVRPEGEAPAAGAAPRSIWLVTRSRVLRIDWAEDAWQAPGVWYRVQLPEPLGDDCLALVLEQGYAERPDTQLTLAELRGVSELQSLDPVQLVGRLSAPGDAGAAVVPALLQAGPAGVEAVVGAFGALDATGRVRALDVLEHAPCSDTARVYVELLTDDDVRTRRRAEHHLRNCGEPAWGELRRAFEASSGATGVRLAEALAVVAPVLAVDLLGPRLEAAEPVHRSEYRDALSRAARQPEAKTGLRRLLGSSGLGVAAEVEVLRALGDALPAFQPEASASFARVAAAARTFEQRFRLLEPAARLAPLDSVAADFVQQALTDPDPYLRYGAARSTPDLPALRAPLLAATRDPGVRVREASALRLGELSLPGAAPVLVGLLSEDAWPRVRAAAARSLASVGPSLPVDAALGEALSDESPSVRSLGLRALGQRGARSQQPAIVARFRDPDEAAPVRAAAARALADLCDPSLLDELTQAAWKMLAERPSPDDVLVGSAAVAALGRLAPADLEQRLAPLGRAQAHPSLERLLRSARQVPNRCTASAAR